MSLAIALFTVGIAIGSLIAAKASHHRPNLALVPVGAVLMGIVSIKISALLAAGPLNSGAIGPWDFMTSLTGASLLLALFALALAGGLYIVPSFTAVQGWAPVDRRARVVAAVNIMNAAYMVASALVVALLQAAGLSVAELFLILGLCNLVVAALVLRAWGRDGVQDVARFLCKLFLRMEVRGIENLPAAGVRAIIAPNHTSLLDGPILHAILPGHAAFAVDTGIAAKRWANPDCSRKSLSWSRSPWRLTASASSGWYLE